VTYIAWPERSVRPYESLWILTQRLLWLNKPNRSALARTIAVPQMDEHCFDLVFGDKTFPRFERQQLRGLLRLSHAQWKRATLDRSAMSGQSYPGIRFCPSCLEFGYHAAVFQLHTVRICPVHRCDLVCGCPNCSKAIPTSLNRSSLRFPFACPRCKTTLVQSAVIIDPPSFGPLAGIATIARWYRRMAQLPRVEAQPCSTYVDRKQSMSPPALLLLELAGGKRAPRLIALDRQPLTRGAVQAASFGMQVPQGRQTCDRFTWEFEPEREERNLVLYRTYRRHLQKSMPGSRRLIRAFRRMYVERLDRSMDIPATEALRVAKVSAFALLLFRYTMEGWNGLYRRHHDEKTLMFWNALPPLGAYYPVFTSSLLCSPCEREWLRDHFFLAMVRGIFEQAVRRTREMVCSGRYFLDELGRLDSSELPYCLGLFNSKGRLAFWSLTVMTDPDQYGIDQHEMTYPLSRPMLYQERI
jgi:hypothetical protein